MDLGLHASDGQPAEVNGLPFCAGLFCLHQDIMAITEQWWCTPLISVDLYEFEDSLIYRVSSRTARATQRNPIMKNKKDIVATSSSRLPKPNYNPQMKLDKSAGRETGIAHT